MFLIRSVFWLAVAFVLIRPGFDLGQAPELIHEAAMAGARELVVSSLQPEPCPTSGCFSAIVQQLDLPDGGQHEIPLPRPRPHRP